MDALRYGPILAAAAAALARPALAAGVLAKDRPETAARAALSVSSTAFTPGAALAPRFSAQGGNRSPPLKWSAAQGARSYAVVVEDPDAPTPSPYVHWVAWNIPPSVTSLPEGVAGGARIAKPVPMLQGRSGPQTFGYSGPNPPAGPAHHYHFEVFALDAVLRAPQPGAGRDALVAAMRGHVVAKGELVGLYQRK